MDCLILSSDCEMCHWHRRRTGLEILTQEDSVTNSIYSDSQCDMYPLKSHSLLVLFP
jgi:hypothetical protein